MGLDGKVADSVLGANDIGNGRAPLGSPAPFQSFGSDGLITAEFLSVLDLVPAMIWVAARDGKCVFFNQSWLRFTGRTPEQELGDGWLDGVYPEDRRVCVQSYLTAQREGSPCLIEYRLRRRDGAFRWIHDTGVSFHDADGQFLGYIGTCVDITDHKQTGDALRETEDRYRSVVTAMAEGIVVTDERGVIFFCNAAAEGILGMSAEEVIGRPVKDSRWRAIHEDGREFSPDSFPVVLTLTTGQPCSNVVMGLPRPQGDIAWLSINTQPLSGEKKGGPLRGVVATFVDITARKLAEQALHRAHEHLEQRVKDRTADLEVANRLLRSEIEGRQHAEQELRESEERYRTVLERAPDAIFLHDGNNILFANRQAAVLFGVMRPEDLHGRAIWDFTDPKDRRQIRNRIAHLHTHGGVLPLHETILVRSDGSRLQIESSATVCPYHGRSIIQVIARDISARIEAQIALRRSAEQISDLYNHAPCGYHSLGSDGTVIRMNDTELSWLGYAREDVVGVRRIVDFMAPGSQATFDAKFAQFIEAGFLRDVEIEMVRKDGSVLPVVLNATAVHDDQGRFLMSRSTVFDMTDIKRAGESLRESEERFRQLADASFEGIVIHEGGTIRDMSAAFAAMFGFSREELIGRTWAELVAPIPVGAAKRPDPPPHALDETPYETIGVRRDGTTFPIEIRGKEIPYQGRSAHVAAVRDLTERHQTEELARQHQAQLAHVLRVSTMGEMATGLAHELNQPLAAIVNYAQGCLRRIRSGAELPSEFVEILSQVTLQARRAGEVIRRLRDFVRKQESRHTRIDINGVVREAVAFLLPEAQQSGLTIAQELDPGLPEIEADMIQIEQVLLNLLRNAGEALRDTQEWPRRITVRTGLGERGMIEVAICDTGPGLSPAMQERLFQPFFTTKSEGLGLGLSISKSIIEAHGGRLWAKPNPDRGMTFRFCLPAGGRPKTADLMMRGTENR